MSFTANGKVLAIAWSRSEIHLVNVADGQLLAKFDEHRTDVIRTLHFDHQGRRLLVAYEDGEQRLLNLDQLQTGLVAMGMDPLLEIAASQAASSSFRMVDVSGIMTDTPQSSAVAVKELTSQAPPQDIARPKLDEPVLRSATAFLSFEPQDFFERGKERFVRDLTGNGNDALCFQVQPHAAGLVGGAVANDGSGRLKLPQKLIANQTNFTIAGWALQRTAKQDAAFYCEGFQTNHGQHRRFGITLNTEQHVYSCIWNATEPGNWLNQTTHSQLPIDRWMFVALRLSDGGTRECAWQITVDRETVGGLSHMLRSGNGRDDNCDYIGVDLNGLLDEVGVWQKCLTDDDIKWLRDRGRGGQKIPFTNPLLVTAERQAAEWVLRDVEARHREVRVRFSDGREQSISPGQSLPDEPFELSWIAIDGAPRLTDAEIGPRIAPLKSLYGLALSTCPQVTDPLLPPLCTKATVGELFVERSGITAQALPQTVRDLNLCWLMFDSTQFSEALVAAISERKGLRQIGLVAGNDEQLRSVLNIPQLRHFRFHEGRASPETYRLISQQTEIHSLELQHSNVTDAAIEELATMPKLGYLSLAFTPNITDECVPHLGRLKKLRILELPGTKLTQAGVEKLRLALPDCRIAGFDSAPKK